LRSSKLAPNASFRGSISSSPRNDSPRISTGQIGALASTLVSNQPNAFSKPRNFLPPCSPKPSNTQCVGILDELTYVPTCSAACPSGIYRISREKENMRKTVACVSLIVSHPRRSIAVREHEHERRHNEKVSRFATDRFLVRRSFAQSCLVFDRSGGTACSQFFHFQCFQPQFRQRPSGQQQHTFNRG
jgi:hypothetical protein